MKSDSKADPKTKLPQNKPEMLTSPHRAIGLTTPMRLGSTWASTPGECLPPNHLHGHICPREAKPLLPETQPENRIINQPQNGQKRVKAVDMNGVSFMTPSALIPETKTSGRVPAARDHRGAHCVVNVASALS